MSKLLVIGLDCLEPSLVEAWLDDLPTFAALMENGAWGRLRSSHPPITVPAWASMLSGRDPGELGIYGFRNRAGHGYHDLSIATSHAVTAPRVWDHLAAADKRSIIVGVPQTWPLKPVPGVLQVSSFLTPPGADYADPPELQDEIETFLARRGYKPVQQQALGARQQARTGPARPLIYETDTHNFRTEDKAQLLADIYRMTEKRWHVVNHLIQHKPWDFFMLVEMGTDRIHHAFWQFMDPEHVHYPGPHNQFERAIHDYYVYLDGQIARLLEQVNEETMLMVVSDHGARRMDGGLVINEWLRREGLLTLAEEPAQPVSLEKAAVDWSQTKIWSSGGYYARLFFNVAGREPQGVVPADEYAALRDDVIARLTAMTGPDGAPLGNVVVKPEDVYRTVNNFAPDLILY
ncbi:MAG: alkaline phosphatase family protein, partial [Caldilineaceae bacterium]